MKPMSPGNRKAWVEEHYNNLELSLTCRTGAVTCDRLLHELAKYITKKRRKAKEKN